VAVKVIVEDDAPTLELTDEVLTSLKVEVHAVSDNELAGALVNQESFDGIFVDLQMPKMDGFRTRSTGPGVILEQVCPDRGRHRIR